MRDVRPQTATSTENTAVVRNDSMYSSSLKRRAKFSSPTNSVDVPNASCSCTDCTSAWPAGQKKKMMMTASCGASSSQGSVSERKRTRFSIGRGC